MSKYVVKNTDTFVPASELDNVLSKAGKKINYRLHSIYDGKVIEDFPKLYKEVIEKTISKVYETIDHLPISIKCNGINYGYISLDNSVRANEEGFALKNRLNKVCELVAAFISQCEGSCIIFFSESCRPSFDTADIINRPNEMTWYQIREKICAACNLYYLGESANNDHVNNMSFGISAFCTDDYKSLVTHVLPKRILNEGIGSGILGICVNNSDPVWGINFPLDFKSVGSENLGAKAMCNLCEIMKAYGDHTCAFGDFNTVVGNIFDAVNGAIPDSMQFNLHDCITFFGAHYDRVNIRPGEQLTSLI